MDKLELVLVEWYKTLEKLQEVADVLYGEPDREEGFLIMQTTANTLAAAIYDVEMALYGHTSENG